MDLLVSITADALGIELNIYQDNCGKIQVLKHSGGPISKAVYLKFTHDDLNTIGNHYDSIIKIKDQVINLPENQVDINLPEKQEVINLHENQEVITEPAIEVALSSSVEYMENMQPPPAH